MSETSRYRRGRSGACAAAASLGLSMLIAPFPATAAGAEEETGSATTTPVSAELHTLLADGDAGGLLLNAAFGGELPYGMTHYGTFGLEGIDSPTENDTVDQSLPAGAVPGETFRYRDDSPRDTPEGITISGGQESITRTGESITAESTVQDFTILVDELSEEAAGLLNVDTAVSIGEVSTAVDAADGEVSTETTVEDLVILGDTVELTGGALEEPVTRTTEFQTDNVVELLPGLGVDQDDVDTYAPLIDRAEVDAALTVTVSPGENGGVEVLLDVFIDVELDTIGGAMGYAYLEVDQPYLEASVAQVSAVAPAGSGEQPGDEDADLPLDGLVSPLRVDINRIEGYGEARGGAMAGLVNAELGDGARLIRDGEFHLPTLDAPAEPGVETYQRDAGSARHNGVRFGEVNSQIERTEEGVLTAEHHLESLVVDHYTFDDDGMIGHLLGDPELELIRMTTNETSAAAGTDGLDAGVEIETLELMGETVNLVDGRLEEPVQRELSNELTDIDEILQAASVTDDIADYIDDPSNLSGSMTGTVDVIASTPVSAEDDLAQAAIEFEIGVEVEIELRLSGADAMLLEEADMSTEGRQVLSTVTVGLAAAAQNEAELPAPGESQDPEEPGTPDPDPGEEAPEDFTGLPSETPDRVILTTTEDPATSQFITWRTAPEIANGVVQLRSGDTVEEIEATTGEIFTAHSYEEGDYDSRSHSATLEGLSPNTTYEYRVGDGGENFSGWYSFTTASDSHDAFEFLWLGDVQNDITEHGGPNVRRAIEGSPNAELVLHAGDQINYADNDYEWAEWFGIDEDFYAEMNHVITAGNHEYHAAFLGPIWRESYTQPGNGPQPYDDVDECTYMYQEHMSDLMKDTVFYTDYQGVRFIVLNSNTVEGWREMLPANDVVEQYGCADSNLNAVEIWLDFQARWVEDIVAEAPGEWTAALFHHPVYSMSSGRDNEHIRASWATAFENAGVDLVLQGHDHTYGRGYSINHEIDQSTGLNDGPNYVVSVVGPKYYTLGSAETWENWGARRMQALQDTSVYQRVNVDGNTLVHETYDVDHNLVDSFVMCSSGNGEKYAANTAEALPADCTTEDGGEEDPSEEPTPDPTGEPTEDPTGDPSEDPTPDPTEDPTGEPTEDPTGDPSEDPTGDPTASPTSDPTDDPTQDPTGDPTSDPTTDPTDSPSTPAGFNPSTEDLDEELEDLIEMLGSGEITPGGEATVVVGEEFADQEATGVLFSDPVILGTETVTSEGTVTYSVPSDVPAGDHRLAVYDTDGEIIGWTAVSVVATDDEDPDATTDPTGEPTEEPTGTSTEEPTEDGTGPADEPDTTEDEETPSADGSSQKDGGLAVTGAQGVWVSLAALTILLVGGLLVVLSRRRRHAAHRH
ncbi:fibronectin type III domain-containing protein [Nesterenkonia alba]|uniref:fibronectin type III domain-containing protein n=1 Tax=Nesterenkonia alba TaxID=515814 RepID=UPI0003FCB430|nr:fibronectin type III domain-containing protein [Nesterenkonia alba]